MQPPPAPIVAQKVPDVLPDADFEGFSNLRGLEQAAPAPPARPLDADLSDETVAEIKELMKDINISYRPRWAQMKDATELSDEQIARKGLQLNSGTISPFLP